MLNAFTVDVEDYFQVSAFERHIDRNDWHRFESRVVANTHRVLRLLNQEHVQATFFVLGWVAERFPELVRDIHRDGHEIGSHSYWHRLIYRQTPEDFRADLLRSRRVLEDIVGQPVTAFRAPSFSVTHRSLWALGILAEEGFLSDSSIFPIRHDRYGIPGAHRFPHVLSTSAGPLWEFPATVRRLGPLNFPVSGGGYFRLYPFSWSRHALTHVNQRDGQPFMFYIHPWELDPAQPRLRVGSMLSRRRHYLNLHSTEAKLSWLMRHFRFGRLCDVLATLRQEGQSSEPALAVTARME